MKKAEFVKAVVSGSETELTVQDGEKIAGAVFREMGRAVLEEGRFVWPGFGTFAARERTARQDRNPRTGETMKVTASRTVAFKPAPSLKQDL